MFYSLTALVERDRHPAGLRAPGVERCALHAPMYVAVRLLRMRPDPLRPHP